MANSLRPGCRPRTPATKAPPDDRLGVMRLMPVRTGISLHGCSPVTRPPPRSAPKVENLLRQCHAVGEIETVYGQQVATEPGVEGRLRGGQPEQRCRNVGRLDE